MKALSLTQPWATPVVTGRKHVETRGWKPPQWALGQRIAIHASKGMPGYAKDAARHFGMDPEALARGAVIGSVVLVKAAPTEDVRAAITLTELEMGDYEDGRYAWALAGAQHHDPIPASGSLGLWDWKQ